MVHRLFSRTSCLLLLCAGASTHGADLVLRGGLIYDGSGSPAYVGDISINGDRIESIGPSGTLTGSRVLDVRGLSVAPGFINMLSWANESLLIDGRSQGDIRQGVTLEVFGEGSSMGPLNDALRQRLLDRQGEARFDIPWRTLGEYLEHLEARGVAPNVASFVGATTVRAHVLGFENRAPNPDELDAMRALVHEAMREGAVGLGSSLIYAPGFYADTDELVALMEVVAQYDGLYISHLRSEGNRLLEALDELIEIARRSKARAEVYHLKVAGRQNWDKFPAVVARIEAARASGLSITANMYTYTAGSTGLDAAMPPWAQEGGYAAWAERLEDPEMRARIAAEMTTPTDAWENLLLAAGAENTLLVGFRNPELRHLTGRTLAAVAAERDKPAHEVAMDLVVADGSRVQVVYFLMSEENVAATIALPWVSFGSDAASMAAEGVFLNRSTHPRAYGNFARVLGRYARDRQRIDMADAVRRLTALPAENLRIKNRGSIKPGFYADLAVFDPARVRDHATYANPHRYSEGMVHILVNGEAVLEHGEHTGRLPGRVVRGPGWQAGAVATTRAHSEQLAGTPAR